MSRLRDERGMTLIELLVAASISLVILGATMTVLAVANRQQGINERQNDAGQVVRTTLDRMARQLRNMASPTDITSVAGTLPRAIDRNLSNDLVFKDVQDVKIAGSLNQPNVRRVRYCLNTETPTNGVLWQQIQTWTTATPPALPADTACPGAGWTTQRQVATNVTNAVGARPVFTYTGDAGTITAVDDSARADVTRVLADLFVDADTTRLPKELELSTSVFLRNQNREPTAVMTGSILNPTSRLIGLNGSASQDPESQSLSYGWYMDGGTTPIGTGIVLQYTVPAGVHTFQLKVFDPAGLEGDSTTYTPFAS
jgi:prepilin-type N-terminal cleavage/methylation domain-containing protein